MLRNPTVACVYIGVRSIGTISPSLATLTISVYTRMNSRTTASCFLFHMLTILSLLCLANSSRKMWRENSCNMYRGSWVHDMSYPLYDSSACHFIRKEFDCLMYGRPDHLYLQYRWQPNDCNLPRYNIIRATICAFTPEELAC